MWMLATKLWFSGRTRSTSNHWVISSFLGSTYTVFLIHLLDSRQYLWLLLIVVSSLKTVWQWRLYWQWRSRNSFPTQSINELGCYFLGFIDSYPNLCSTNSPWDWISIYGCCFFQFDRAQPGRKSFKLESVSVKLVCWQVREHFLN